MKKIIIISLFMIFIIPVFAAKLDLNTASLEELKILLPITEQQADDIYNYRFYISFFESIYQLREIESIDQETLNSLKPLVSISHYDEKDESAQRRDDIYYLIERLGSNEGLQEGMSDIWEDYLISPRNINKLAFSDILNLPNTSPLDVAAILNRVAVGDSISSYRDLRKSPGISYYGAKNLQNYIYYKEKEYSISRKNDFNYQNKHYQTARSLYKKPTPIGEILSSTFTLLGNLSNSEIIPSGLTQKQKSSESSPLKTLFFDYQMKYNDSPYGDSEKEMFMESMIRFDTPNDDDPSTPGIKRQSYWGYYNMESHRASLMNKLRMRYKNQFKAGFIYENPKGTTLIFDSNSRELIEDGKFYIGYENNINLLGNNFLKVYTGNFRATFGEGLVMENTDSYSPRKTGYGFNKRITGIIGDISRTQEYALRGIALDWKRNNMNAVFFLSSDKKDAVVYDSNENGELDDDDYVLGYINMTNRFSNAELEEAEAFFNDYAGNQNQVRIAPRLDALQEDIIGGHLEYSPFIGTHIGITGYEAVYDREFVVPEGDELKELLIYHSDYHDKWKITDNEITNMYSTISDDYGDRNYRRVVGFDWRTVLSNTSIQGEYAELEKDGSLSKIGDDPSALLISSYTQFDNLYLLSVYRDYDLDFDNPYHRSFSESERYDDTVFDKMTYGLNNTLLNDMYNNSAQPSAEKGIYFETRYQFHKMLTLNKAYLDIWERKSDARRGVRAEVKLEFKPIHQLRFRIRHKHQVKRYDDDMERGKSQADETELKFITYLSNYDKLQLGYIYARVLQPPYLSILSNPAEPSAPDMSQAQTLTTGDMIYLDYTHNFNKNLKIIGAFAMWYANGASFWDFEDIELDFDHSDRGFKTWFNIHSRIANNVYLSLKYKYKQFLTRELEFRDYNDIPEEGEYYFQRVEREENIVRMQLDWKF